MLHKTTGIVFRTIKYAETSVISTIYTREFGLLSFIISGVRSAKSKQKASAFQPMMLLELDLYYREGKSLLRIKEFRHHYLYRSLPFDVFKSAVGLFYIDVLHKVIKEHESSEALYRYIEQVFIQLDQTDDNLSAYPIDFLIQLSDYVGLSPQGAYNNTQPYFDLSEGVFCATPQRLEYAITPPLSEKFYLMLQQKSPMTTYAERKELLQLLLNYYSLHNADLRKLQSLSVLESVFH
ncbi:MAG: DNA repair protein RecO [Bacteroidetes bacterium]|nr:DNA repair protein RecO [Bacteroidota bacterium]